MISRDVLNKRFFEFGESAGLLGPFEMAVLHLTVQILSIFKLFELERRQCCECIAAIQVSSIRACIEDNAL